MKKKIRKKFWGFLLSALLVLTISLSAFADMGPKPSVTLKLYYTPQQRYAVTLLGSTKVSGPWGAVPEYRERMGSREAWEAFRNYDAPEGYYFLDYFQEYPGDADEEFVWGYYPPNKFYVLLYNLETGEFYRSEEPVERYAFSSEWQVLLDNEDGGLRVYHNRNDADIFSLFAARVLITLILELAWGILVFHLNGAAQRDLIGKVNLATQIVLNLGVCYGTLHLGPMWGSFLYLFLEVLVFIAEACAYCCWLPWPEGKTPHPVLYALTANLLSFGVGWVLNAHCSNTQVRLIGLGCLLLWYAIPQLGRKPARFEQNVQETDKKL